MSEIQHIQSVQGTNRVRPDLNEFPLIIWWLVKRAIQHTITAFTDFFQFYGSSLEKLKQIKNLYPPPTHSCILQGGPRSA